MPSALRVGLVVLGAAMAVYGVASLTGGWLGTPPWWERHDDVEVWVSLRETDGLRAATTPEKVRLDLVTEREGRTRVSMVVIGAGLALVAVGAWPRRRAQDPAGPHARGAVRAAGLIAALALAVASGG